MSAIVIYVGLKKTTLNALIYSKLTVMMFLQYFVWGVYYVTMGTYLFKIGFKGSDIGQAYGATSIAGIVSPFLVGMVADRFFPAQKVLAAMHIMGGVVMYIVSQTVAPGAFFWVFLLYACLYMPTIALTNSISFYQMKEPGKEFPFIRVWGTIGWIVAGLIVSAIKQEDTNTPMVICAAVSALTGVLCLLLPNTPPKGSGQQIRISDVLGLKALKMFRDPSFLVFAIASTLICIPLAFYYNFTNAFLNQSGMTGTAAKMTMGQMSEIIFMIIMPFFFARLGVKKMLVIGMAAWALRYVMFAYGNADALVWMFYLGIILHGICYDFFFVTGQIYVDNSAPVEIQASAQGLITLLTYGIGMLVGSLISGFVVDHYKQGENLYNWHSIWLWPFGMAGIVMIAFLLFFKDKGNGGKVSIQ
ncbi:MAG: nucleoside permease [Opitutae bacterium]|nr:nucleoside permease [Opitutae bacterium]